MPRHRQHDSLETAFPPEMRAALNGPRVTELMVNADARIWTEQLHTGMEPQTFRLSADRVEGLAATVAGRQGLILSRSSPILEAEFPHDGSRITALLPPVVSAPVLAIRKHLQHLIRLDEYVDKLALSPARARSIRQAISERRNIVISGGPGSGKTTFANALILEMEQLAPEMERFILIEDTYELRCEAANHVVLHTTEHVTLRDLVKVTLRLRPDRIIVGEVRGAEALDLLKAWNTGNPGGCTTVHANSAEDALHRLDQLAQEAGAPSQAQLVASSVDMVVHMERRGSKRQVTELITVKPFKPQTDYIVEAVPAE